MNKKLAPPPSPFFKTLTLLWIWLLSKQWVSFTEDIFFEETTKIIVLTLAVTALIEAIHFIGRGFRLIIEFVLILYIVRHVLHEAGMHVPSGLLEGFIGDEAMYLLPYLWFALAAWAIFILISYWATGKRRVLFVVGMNVIAFAVLDSFTTVELWKETAWVVAIGMGWLVTDHFNRFRHKFPQGWRRLRAYPVKIIANILVIFSLIILAGINMPSLQPTLTDPYTAWREWSGLPFAGSAAGAGGGILEAPGESLSGYGREDDKLGGGFNFDYTPVMTVTTEERGYWRGETRTEYSGEGWVDRQRIRGMENISPGEGLTGDLQSDVPTKKVKQSVVMLNDIKYPVIFGAYSIAQIDGLDPETEPPRLRWKSEGAELHLNLGDKQRYPKSYTVTSEMPVIPWDELIEKNDDELYGSGIDSAYLQVPSNFPQRVKDLAEEVTIRGNTPYEKVMLLQQYLQGSFTYTNTPDLSKKKSRDFVDSFLFEIKEGYCDYYSTSMVMMTRSLGIPARWVKGYAPGNLPAENFASPRTGEAGASTYTVTNADAHSWVEIYFGDYGWIPIETTPGFNMPILSGGEAPDPSAPEVPDEEPKEEDKNTDVPSAGTDKEDRSGLKIAGMAAGAIILLWIGYILWRMRLNLRFLRERIRSGKPLTPADKVIAETERWLRAARRRGLTRDVHETLRESVLRWVVQNPSLESSLHSLLSQFEAARYSPAHIHDEEWKSVQAEAARLRKNMKNIKTA